MLTHFPTPYPGEWWYSILCRYHVRSGHAKQQTTVWELFGRERVPLGSVFPNGTLRQICSQLPAEVFPIRQMILQHTLFPFYMRCQPFPVKEEMLGRLCRGEMATITGIRKFAEKDSWRPRYCPCCAIEEQREWGEPYWHVEHQIPLMSHCPAHGCRLVPVEDLPIGQMDYSFSHFPISTSCHHPHSQRILRIGSVPCPRSSMTTNASPTPPAPQKDTAISPSPSATWGTGASRKPAHTLY